MELGRRDGLVSTAASVNGNLPGPNDNVDKLNKLFAKNKLTQDDMIALSGINNINFMIPLCLKFKLHLLQKVIF